MDSIHKIVKDEYTSRHRSAVRSAEDRKKKLIDDIPSLKQAFFELSQTGIKFSKEIIEGKLSHKEAMEASEIEFKKLSEKLRTILIENSYDERYLDAQFVCNICQDTGFINKDGDRCKCYSEVIKHILGKHRDYAVFSNQNFNFFDETLYPCEPDPNVYGIKKSPRQQILAIKEKCMDFISTFSNPETKNMLFTGNTGLGKTFVANCITYDLLLKGYSVIVITAPMFFEITSGYLIDHNRFSEDYAYLLSCNLLIIDDMGTEKMTDSRYSQLLNILEIRKKNDLTSTCKVILITNSTINELYDIYSERIASRIAGDFSIIKFIGKDIRILNKEVSQK